MAMNPYGRTKVYHILLSNMFKSYSQFYALRSKSVKQSGGILYLVQKVLFFSNLLSIPFNKLFLEEIARDMQKADPEWKIILLRYFNPVGAHESGKLGEDPKGIPNNLMPYIQQVAVGRLPELNIYGHDYPTPDGTAV